MPEEISLRKVNKGEKVAVGFTNITVGLGWEPNEGTGEKYDLDVSAIMIDENKKTSKDFFIFYGNLCGRRHSNLKDESGQLMTHSDSDCIDLNCNEGLYGVMHTGDDPDGTSSDGDDDESILIDLTKVPQNIQEILFVVTIDDAVNKRQNFGQVRDSYIRLIDNNSGKESIKYELGEDFSVETGIEFGRLYKKNNEWKFDASGIGYKEDLAFFLEKYFTGKISK